MLQCKTPQPRDSGRAQISDREGAARIWRHDDLKSAVPNLGFPCGEPHRLRSLAEFTEYQHTLAPPEETTAAKCMASRPTGHEHVVQSRDSFATRRIDEPADSHSDGGKQPPRQLVRG